VNGIAFCGIDAGAHVTRLISLTCGSALRAWISLVSRIAMSRPVGSAMYARLPSSLSDMPWEVTLPCHTTCGSFVLLTSIAVIDVVAVPVA
jgi:hypothetical protein